MNCNRIKPEISFFLLLAFFIGGFSAPLKAQHLDFIKQYGPNGPSTRGNSIEELPDGSLIVAATASMPTSTPGQYQADIMLLKISAAGDTLWTKNIGDDTRRELATSLALLANGNMVICGYVTPAPPAALLTGTWFAPILTVTCFGKSSTVRQRAKNLQMP